MTREEIIQLVDRLDREQLLLLQRFLDHLEDCQGSQTHVEAQGQTGRESGE